MRFRISASPAIRAAALEQYGQPRATIIAGLVEWHAGGCAALALTARAMMARTRFPENREAYRQRARVAAEACRMRLRTDDGRRRAY